MCGYLLERLQCQGNFLYNKIPATMQFNLPGLDIQCLETSLTNITVTEVVLLGQITVHNK